MRTPRLATIRRPAQDSGCARHDVEAASALCCAMDDDDVQSQARAQPPQAGRKPMMMLAALGPLSRARGGDAGTTAG